MLAKRIISCLDVKEGRVVKGTRFVNLRDAGDPVEVAAVYDQQGADELVFLDITASYERRRIMIDVVARTAEQAFMPLTVGGGIRFLEDIRGLLKAGADKVSLNTAAVEDPEVIRRNFTMLLEEMFRAGFFVGIATHDERLAWEAERLIRVYQRTALQYEFQMLLGVGERLRDTLRASGHPVRIYVPFGPDWHPYTMRRLRKNPAIVGHVMRRMFGRGA